ncbi:hypothetical protein POSPLADRAFT_1049362 [Postia placenta MAD-698-R-SB12]|uniref:F-box domain-containing protein n=1 Tax=Postia placenta MAD-698-R-SB12 TaxID=670580 RepID=A0A1X6MQE3_9APHY|nr:hypothetical protein POSPLADRAFT_1049362 [Postia placenta MAD-698-R-SB12]OSX58617.1 hypothetical protein POSPLADRAFT_1049362 [Postia placenta MAD-698-R-SB12]
MAITDLPPELLVAVFSLLMAADLVNVKQLQYIIELELLGMSDNPPCGLPTSTKLHRLRELARSWRDMRFTPGISLPAAASRVYAFSAGVFAQVNSKGVSIEERRWTVKPTDVLNDIEAIYLDPSQDLLVVVAPGLSITSAPEWRLHLLSLTGPGTPHPLTSEPCRTFGDIYGFDSNFSMHIEGDILGFFLSPGFGSVRCICSWKSPSVVLDLPQCVILVSGREPLHRAG